MSRSFGLKCLSWKRDGMQSIVPWDLPWDTSWNIIGQLCFFLRVLCLLMLQTDLNGWIRKAGKFLVKWQTFVNVQFWKLFLRWCTILASYWKRWLSPIQVTVVWYCGSVRTRGCYSFEFDSSVGQMFIHAQCSQLQSVETMNWLPPGQLSYKM